MCPGPAGHVRAGTPGRFVVVLDRRGTVWYNTVMKLAWHRRGAGFYRAVTGRAVYTIAQQDFSGFWNVTRNRQYVGFGHTLREAKGIAQIRENETVNV